MTVATTTYARSEPRIDQLNLVSVGQFDERGFWSDLAMGRTLNISHGGIRLELTHPLPIRSRVQLTLELGDRLLEVSGRVCHIETIDESRCSMGIEFLDLTIDGREALDAYLRQVHI